MPRYYVILDDPSTHPEYRWDEKVVRSEFYPLYDNRQHHPEQDAALLSQTRVIIYTEYTAKPGTSVNPYTGGLLGPIQGPMTLDSFYGTLTERKDASAYFNSNPVGSGVRSSPNGPKDLSARGFKKKSRPGRNCPPGFRYDFKSKTCVKIKGRNKNATKKKFRNNKRR